jgi:hypothetical protein
MPDKLPIILGGNVPTAAVVGEGIEEAPIDGEVYGRENAGWTRLDVSPSIEEAPIDGDAYVRMNGRWVKLTNVPFADLTPSST